MDGAVRHVIPAPACKREVQHPARRFASGEVLVFSLEASPRHSAETAKVIQMMETVDLHDTTLLGVRIDWESGTCVVDLRHASLGRCYLTFSVVTNLSVPRKRSWGPSSSIQAFGKTGSAEYAIEMQSGDLIRIEAASVVLTVSEPA